MSDFSSIKSGSLNLPKAPKFNSLPSFTKAGLLHFQKYQNVRKQNFDQRIAVCENLKAKANNLFLDGEYEEAVNQYEQALSIFRYISLKQPNVKLQAIKDEQLEYVDLSSPDSGEKLRISEMKVALLNNLAACYLKLKDFKSAIEACGEVLFLDPLQTKAWYRRAKATISKTNIEIQEHIRAREDLKRAYELDPKDANIEELYHQVNEEVNRILGPKKESSNNTQKQTDKVTIEEVKNSEASKSNKQPETGKGKTNKGGAKSKKEPEEEIKVDSKSSTQTSESGKEDKSQKIDTDNDVWKMLHGDVDPNSQNYNYELSFEINPNAKVPKEIEEFGKYIENRARELIAIYEKSGKRKEIPQLRENLKQAIATHKRLENISKLDFTKPGPKLRETAARLNLDLNDPSLRVELVKMQEQNLEDVRKWLKTAKASQPQPVKTESRYEKLRSRKALKSSGKAGLSHTTSEKSSASSSSFTGLFSKLFSGSSSKKEQEVLNAAADAIGKTSNQGINAKEGGAPQKGSNSVLTFAFYCLIIVFFIYLLIVDQQNQFSKKTDAPDTDV